MADQKVSAMTNASALGGGEEFHVVQSTNDRAASIDQVKTYVTTTPLAVVGNATAGAELRLPEDTDNGSNYVAIKAPDSLSATYTLTLPSDDGSADQYLKTDGSGNLSWAAGGGAAAPLTLASGTITDPSTALTITQTWNDGADTFVAMSIDAVRTAAGASSVLFRARCTDINNAGMELFPADSANNATLRVNDQFSGNFSMRSGGGTGSFTANGTCVITFDENGGGSGQGTYLAADRPLGWGSSNATSAGVNTRDISLHRIGAGVLGVRGAAGTDGGALNFVEQTAPSSPSANQIVLYAEDNAGTTVLRTKDSAGTVVTLGAGASAPLTLAGGTVTDPSTPLTITQTWNDAADTFEAFVVSVTNTASAAASELMDLRVGGSSVMTVRRDGFIAVGSNSPTSNAGIGHHTSGDMFLTLYGGGSGSDPKMLIGGGSFPNALLPANGALGWSSNNNPTAAVADTTLFRSAAGIISVRGSGTSTGGALNFVEQTAPSAPSANEVVIYAEDNGSGKTRLMARFATGAAQVLATEP